MLAIVHRKYVRCMRCTDRSISDSTGVYWLSVQLWKPYFRSLSSSFIPCYHYLFLELHSVVLMDFSWLYTQRSLLVLLRGHMGCWGLSPDWAHARQTLYLLYYCSSPSTSSLSTNSILLQPRLLSQIYSMIQTHDMKETMDLTDSSRCFHA